MISEDKICPFMSRCKVDKSWDHITAEAICIKDRCMAWQPKKKITTLKNKKEIVIQKETPGYCKLIDMGLELEYD